MPAPADSPFTARGALDPEDPRLAPVLDAVAEAVAKLLKAGNADLGDDAKVLDVITTTLQPAFAKPGRVSGVDWSAAIHGAPPPLDLLGIVADLQVGDHQARTGIVLKLIRAERIREERPNLKDAAGELHKRTPAAVLAVVDAPQGIFCVPASDAYRDLFPERLRAVTLTQVLRSHLSGAFGDPTLNSAQAVQQRLKAGSVLALTAQTAW